MRTLRVINASTNTRQVAYRNINEVKEDLKALRDLIFLPKNVDNIHNSLLNLTVKLNNRQAIMENLDLIYYYDDIAKRLVSIKAQLTYGFKDKPDYEETLDLVRDLNKDLELKLGVILKQTHSYCWKSLDSATRKSLRLVANALKKEYPGKVFLLLDSIKVKGKFHLVYRFYIRLSNIKDDTNFVYPYYYILVTKVEDNWYINTSAIFKLIRFMDAGSVLKRKSNILHNDILMKIKQVMQQDGL